MVSQELSLFSDLTVREDVCPPYRGCRRRGPRPRRAGCPAGRGRGGIPWGLLGEGDLCGRTGRPPAWVPRSPGSKVGVSLNGMWRYGISRRRSPRSPPCPPAARAA
ncbi:hypothetical protein DMH25_12105 [Streptomyces sp. WAC 01325]|nr:hypothetical protein DMH25_12105 [Streptomyces sp. WAC 01325]